jgi:putative transposase
MKTIRPGQLVYWRNEPYIVLEIRGLSEVVVRSIDNQISEVAHVSEISMAPLADKSLHAPHIMANKEGWDVAMERYELIRPLLEMHNRQASDVERVARSAKKSITTLYRWIVRFEEQGLVSSLMRSGRSDKGNLRIEREAEEVIQLKIDEYFLKEERPSVVALYDEIKRECSALDIEPPHKNTVYARVKKIDKERLLKSRYSPKLAKTKTKPTPGTFPGADYPNAVVQIDHTKVDVIVVDREHRLPIGRPYLTLALEVCTKMVSGFCMTLDPPSSSTAGLSIAHAVSRKEHWLAKRDIDAEWPIYGKMQKIHLDNAKEFRGSTLKRACQEHRIGREWRPVGTPNYGPHVERAFRTFMQEIHTLPGTTFSNTVKKIEYDSEGKACMTLEELNLWFTVFLVYCYHHKPHKGICNIPPIKLYNQFVHGTLEQPGIGLPAPIDDEEKFRLDFTPFVMRRIQLVGVVIDKINYYSPVLRKWIDAKEPGDKTKAKKFIFVRDPRDISVIYFLDPDTKTYAPVTYSNNTRPAISLWELRAVTKKIKEDPLNVVDEGVAKMRAIEKEAIEKTRLAKNQRAKEKRKLRLSERRKDWGDVHQDAAKPNKDACQELVETKPTETVDIEPFADIELEGVDE